MYFDSIWGLEMGTTYRVLCSAVALALMFGQARADNFWPITSFEAELPDGAGGHFFPP